MRDRIIRELKKLTKHSYIELTERGNTAIFAALYCARKLVLDENYKIMKKTVIIPDQAGWLTYEKYPKMLELEVKKVKTEHGIIDLGELKKISKDACVFIYANPAGYFAEQPIREIYNICKNNNCLVILDVTGSIGDAELSDGSYADFIVCSFGRWKPVNLGYGGFISAAKKEYFEMSETQRVSEHAQKSPIFDKAKEIFNTIHFDEKYLPLLEKKLSSLTRRLNLLYERAKKVKNDLKELSIIHRDKKGINVIVKFDGDEEKEKIINYCKNNNLEYTLCPRYIRVMDKAISIEIKRLEVK